MHQGNDFDHVYTQIADAYERRGRGQMRDRFLVLAADAALHAGRGEEAERLRRRLLLASPHHLLKPYASFAQAMAAPDLLAYVQDLRKNYPPKVAVELLSSMKLEDEATAGQGTGPAANPVEPRPPAPAPEPPIYKIRTQDAAPAKPAPPLAPTMPPGKLPAVSPAAIAGAKSKNPSSPRSGGAEVTAPTSPPRPRTAHAPGGVYRVANESQVPPSPSAHARSSEPESSAQDNLPQGAWLAAMLFGLFVTGGLVLLAYVLAAPFWPGN